MWYYVLNKPADWAEPYNAWLASALMQQNVYLLKLPKSHLKRLVIFKVEYSLYSKANRRPRHWDISYYPNIWNFVVSWLDTSQFHSFFIQKQNIDLKTGFNQKGFQASWDDLQREMEAFGRPKFWGKGEIILTDFPAKYINISETKYYLLVYNSHFDQFDGVVVIHGWMKISRGVSKILNEL